jgi:outer membrane protein OmpA-like peptidoglycan-associated protein
MKIRHPFVAAALGFALTFALAWPVGAQTTPPVAPVPDTTSMIEALKPLSTRSMRNLMVRQRADPAASAVPSAAVPPASAAALAAAPPASAAPAAVVAAPAAAPGAATGPAPSLSLAIQFESNSSRVRPESGPVLGNLVAALQSPELKAIRFAIEGHTDAAGPAARNLALSQERADEVRLYLVALGVHPSRLKAVGKGATQPANPMDPLAAENRRVRVVTLQ